MVLVVPEPDPPGETGDGDALPPGVPDDAAVVLTGESGSVLPDVVLWAGLGDELFPEWPGPS